jgi:glycosyltransferase involved in cell wall biosynthesis
MRVVQVNPSFDASLTDPEALLAHYDTLVGWSEALLEAGASWVTVVQAFGRDADLRRGGIDYRFRADAARASPRRWSRPRRLLSAAAEAAPDVAHLNGLAFPRPTAALRRALAPAAALVLQDHSGGPPEPIVGSASGLRGLVWRKMLEGVDAFLFTAPEQARPWQQAGLIRPGQAVHAVVEGSRGLRALPRAGARRTTGVSGSPALLWVGRLDANKDPLTVLEGFEQAALPGSSLTMVHASDELLPEVRRRIAASRFLEARVRLCGRIPHEGMAAFFSAADLFVLGSHKEGSGYSLIEALACGAVPAVTDIPSFRAITGDGAVGALWAVDRPETLAAALRRLAGEDLERLSAGARAHFQANLSWSAIGRRALAIYREVVEKRRQGALR